MILSLETLDTLYSGRLVERASVSVDLSDVHPLIMQMTFLLLATPGILCIYQGSEYLESARMEDLPAVLSIEEHVGVLEGNHWSQKGDQFWFYHYTKHCLEVRQTLGLYRNNDVELFYEDPRTSLLVFTFNNGEGMRLLILHPSAEKMEVP